jgi:hypothetical protein
VRESENGEEKKNIGGTMITEEYYLLRGKLLLNSKGAESTANREGDTANQKKRVIKMG